MEEGGESEKVLSKGTTRLVVLELAATLLKSDMVTIDGDEIRELVEEDVDDSESAGLLLWSESEGKVAIYSSL